MSRPVMALVSASVAGLATAGGAVGAGGVEAPMSFRPAPERVVETTEEVALNWKHVDCGDVDRDGDIDVLVGNGWPITGAPRPNKLYLNERGVLVEVSGPPIIPDFTEVSDATVGAFLVDVDDDGWLDILLINDYGSGGGGGRSRLLMSRHADGVLSHFEDEGLQRLPDLGVIRGSAAAVLLDADVDGDADVFIAADGPDHLFVDVGGGFFVDVSEERVPPDDCDGEDVGAGDVNGDGLADVVVSNKGNCPGLILYNGIGVKPGDFRGGVELLPPSGIGESGFVVVEMEGISPGVDLYRGNETQSTDVVRRNTGNGRDGLAELEPFALSQQVSAQVSCKPSAADLDGDGRPEIIVTASAATPDGRPVILRNTSVNDAISFVDWTPGSAFPNGVGLAGWDVVVLDSDGDGDLDVFLGGSAHDHLFEQIPGTVVDEDDVPGGVLPAFFDGDPVAVAGRGHRRESDTFSFQVDGAGGFVSAVLAGPDDYRLVILDAGLDEIGSSDRGGAGVEEALQVDVAAGTVFVRVEVIAVAPVPADVDGDRVVGLADLDLVIAGWGPCRPGVCGPDVDGSGVVDVVDLIAVVIAWGPVADGVYALELLARH